MRAKLCSASCKAGRPKGGQRALQMFGASAGLAQRKKKLIVLTQNVLRDFEYLLSPRFQASGSSAAS